MKKIQKMLDWLIKHHIGVIFTILGLTVVTPLIIWFLYFIGQSGGIHTDISADGILQYIAPIISSLATLFVGIIALTQSEYASEMAKQANEISSKLAEIEINKYNLELRPFVMITDWQARIYSRIDLMLKKDIYCIFVDDSREDNVLGISLSLTNTTKSYLSLDYREAHENSDNGKRIWLRNVFQPRINRLRLNEGSTSEIVLCASRDFFKEAISRKITIELMLENRFGKRYQESFEFYLMHLEDIHWDNQNYLAISASIQNYMLFRYETNAANQYELVEEIL